MPADDVVHADAGKHDFHAIYDHPDPRPYFRTLDRLDYELPGLAGPSFRRCLDALETLRRDRGLTVIDICCGYGVNAMLLNHRVALGELYDRYGRADVAAMARDELIAADRAFLRRRRIDDPHVMVGIDVAARAVAYARETGALDHGFALDLAVDPLDERLAALAARADLIVITGGVGYLEPRALDRLLALGEADRRPWVATLPLRSVAYAPFAAALARHGLTTETWAGGTFPQRRFVDDEERAKALRRIAGRGLDPARHEARGFSHATFCLSRPRREARRFPLDELVRRPAGAGPAFEAPRAGLAC